MEDNKRDYSDFFNRSKQDEPHHTDSQNSSEREQPAYYYSYGPFKSTNQEDPTTTATSMNLNGNQEISSVDVSAPKLVKPYSISQGYANSGMGSWEYKEQRKRTSFKSIVASFLAGALVISTLMFASDKMNLFTPEVLAQNSATGGKAYTANYDNGGSGSSVTTALAGMRPDNIADMVAGASPAVVKIETYVKSGQSSNRRPNSFFNDDDIFKYFFGDDFTAPPSGQGAKGRITAGMGTGFFFDKSGYILTNEHVIAGADEIEVVVEGYKDKFKAELLGTAPDLDLAVVKITGQDEFSTLALGSSDALRVGDWVTAIGNPIGFDHTVSVGVLSAKDREIQIPDQNRTRTYKNLLQTDASINPGNSGGPLLNINGEVIGINTAVSSQAQGIGFAIPTSTIMGVLDNLKNNVKIPRPFVGVSMQDIENEWLKELGLESTDGILIRSVVRNSPADKAGLQPYDVVTEINGQKIKNKEAFSEIISKAKIGEKISLSVVRDGTKMTTGVTIGDQNNM